MSVQAWAGLDFCRSVVQREDCEDMRRVDAYGRVSDAEVEQQRRKTLTKCSATISETREKRLRD